YILDGCAYGIGINQDDIIHILLCKAEGFFADQLDGGTVGKQTDIRHVDPAASLEAACHGIGLDGLHADHLDFGAYGFDVSRNAGDDAAAADGDENGVNIVRMLTQDFHSYRALTGNDVWVVKRMDKSQLV